MIRPKAGGAKGRAARGTQPDFSKQSESSVLKLRVIPGARRSEIVGMHGDSLKLKVSSPAQEGKANDAVLELLAHELAISVRSLSLVSGAKSRDKVVEIFGVGSEAIQEALARVLENVARIK